MFVFVITQLSLNLHYSVKEMHSSPDHSLMFSTFSWLEDLILKNIYLSAWSKLVFYWSILELVRDWRVPIAGWQQCPNLLWLQTGKVTLALISEAKSELSLVFLSATSTLGFSCWKARFVILIKPAMLQGLPC